MRLLRLALLAVLAVPGQALAQMVPMSPDAIRADLFVNFDDQLESLVIHNGVLDYGGIAFAEGFIGQQLRDHQGNDLLRGLPMAGLLEPMIGQSNANLMSLRDQSTGNVSLFGLGSSGAFSADGVGTGAVSWLLSRDASAVGFSIGRGGRGFVFASFYRRDGSLIDSMKLRNVGGRYAFRAPAAEIAGVTIHNNISGGISLDDIAAEFAP